MDFQIEKLIKRDKLEIINEYDEQSVVVQNIEIIFDRFNDALNILNRDQQFKGLLHSAKKYLV